MSNPLKPLGVAKQAIDLGRDLLVALTSIAHSLEQISGDLDKIARATDRGADELRRVSV